MNTTRPATASYAKAIRTDTGDFLKRVFETPLLDAPDRRFRWLLPADVTAAQEELKKGAASPVLRAATAMMRACMLFQEAVRINVGDFSSLALKSGSVQIKNAFIERRSPMKFDPSMMQSVFGLQELMTNLMASATKESLAYMQEKSTEILPSMLMWDLEGVATFWEKQVAILDIVVNKNPSAMISVRGQMGCRWKNKKHYEKIAETPRAILYRVLPRRNGVKVRMNGKSVIHVSPLILKQVILDLLPDQGLSLVGQFADAGTPTYFMCERDIDTTVEAQVMTEEDFLLDLEFFAKRAYEIHDRKVTLHGTCQGALPTLHAVCSKALAIGKYVDAWVGLVPAYALHASSRVRADMEKIPASKRNDLMSITKKLSNGNHVVPGEIASFASRLKTDPWTALIRAMKSAEKGPSSLMGLAIAEYLQAVIPMSFHMMEMSHTCATKPISEDGVFPVRMFGDEVSFAHAIQQGIKLYVVAGEKDEVVDLEAALRMFQIECVLNYKGAGYHVVPGVGHIALMTTCALPTSKNYIGNPEGPLGYHLRLEALGTKKRKQ